ncbi:MAG: sensor histidine kinase, partial [Bacteroidota bacterium]
MKNRLYWKISATLFSILGVLGLIYILISSFMAQQYFQEVNQRLYGGIAESTVQEVKPLVDGQVDTSAIQDIMHSMMVVNPSVEVYLLDTEGRIITYVAPYKRVKLKSVDLAPVKQFIADRDRPQFILGDDPRHPGQIKAFS